MRIGDYYGFERLHDGRYTIIYRARSSVTQQFYILKVPKSEPPTAEQSQKLKREFDIVSGMNIEGIVKAVALLPYHNGYVLVLEDGGGMSLQQLMKQQPLTLEEILDISTAMASTVAQLHRHRIIHKDLKPRNIIVEPVHMLVQITDFGIASQFPSEIVSPAAPGLLEGTLPYMSPEQTGRMNRMVDYRTDLYSLGATLYEMITGVPPFQVESPMEWIHCHLARSPVPPVQMDERVPQPLSEIVMKCLAKNPEDRYQSAFGLEQDLAQCRQQLRQHGHIAGFTIGGKDRKDVFHIPQRLYGREEEVARLKALYERLGYGGGECAFIHGQAGVGKSSIVYSLMKEVTLDGGLFISGKFDVLKRHVPYSGVLQGLREVLRSLASESGEELAIWKQRITQGLKDSLCMLMQVLPELEWIVGSQDAPHPLSAAEAKNRLHYAVLHLLVCLSESRRMVWFLDDLQWADAGSLQLLHFLTIGTNDPSLLFIGAYREEEWEKEHTLRWLVGEIKARRARTEFIALTLMDEGTLHNMLHDTFGGDLDKSHQLARILLDHTKGNPFVLKQFLHGLVEQRMLWFDQNSNTWTWDVQRLMSLKVSDQMSGFLLERIDQLSLLDKETLEVASCIADRFDLGLLAELLGLSLHDLQLRLDHALGLKLIAASGASEFIFLHDRIRNYFYDLISEEEKQRIHLRIASHIEEYEAGMSEGKLFLVAHHYRLGWQALTDPSEYQHVAETFQHAAEQAKASAAFASALEWYTCGIGLLEPSAWEHSYALAFGLHLGLLESQSLQGMFEDTRDSFIQLQELAKTPKDRAAVYTVMVNQYTQMGLHEKAISTGMEGLRRAFGMKFNDSPDNKTLLLSVVDIQIRKTWRRIRKKPKNKAVAHEELSAQMKLLMDTATSAYFVNPTLYLYMMLTIVRYSVVHGNFTESSNAYNAYGLLLGFGFGQYARGYELGRYGLELSNQFMHPGLRCKTHFTFAVFISPWKRHARLSIEDLWSSYHAGMEAGDLVFAGYAITYVLLLQDFLGVPSVQWVEEADRYLPFLQQTGNPETLQMIRLNRKTHANLQGEHGKVALLAVSEEEEQKWICDLKQSPNQVVLHVFYIKKMMLSYLFEDYEAALEMSRKSEDAVHASFGLYHTVEHVFYTAVTLCAVAERSSPDRQRTLLLEARRCERRLDRWAREAPDNFRHLYLLARAERLRIRDRVKQAERAYEQAVECAHMQGYVQFTAMAAEKAAAFYAAQNRAEASRLCMAEAYRLYGQWGAISKVKQLEQAFPELKVNLHTTTTTLSTEAFDLEAIMGVSQALSREIILQRLLEKIMTTLIRVSGATKGVLMVKHADGIYVEAEGEGEGDGEDGKGIARHTDAQEIHAYKKLPISMVHYVARTMEHVVLDDAAQQGLFVGDFYIQRYRPRSILCLPILHQGTLNAIVYLENQLTSHVFNDQRRMVVHMLAGQAAISIEHAKLVSMLEHKVKERTDELMLMEIARRKLLSNISHDLGTPLTSIQGYVEAILDHVVTDREEQTKYLKVIHSRVLSIQRLIKDLIQLSKMETNQLSMNKTTQPVMLLVQWLSQKHELDIEQAGIRYDVDIHPSLTKLDEEGSERLRMLVDRERMGQVFANLIYNAIHYTPKQGTIRLSAALEADGDYLLLQVADTGTGIPENDVPHVFERFYRGSKSDNSHRDGSGLGLAIAREIIQLHEGQIWVESFVGQGSTFYVRLPLSRENTLQQAAH